MIAANGKEAYSYSAENDTIKDCTELDIVSDVDAFAA
jgi:hypothetical protein